MKKMFGKIKKFGEKPITWKAYGKMAVGCYVICIIVWLIYLISIGWIDIPKLFKKNKPEIKNVKPGDSCFDVPVDDF